MSGRRISKLVPASPEDIVILGLWVPPPVIVGTSFWRGCTVVGDGHYDSDLSSEAIAAAVIQMARMLPQGKGKQPASFLVIRLPETPRLEK
ncbi:hypothetical protein AVEN_92895-1 [Araneus ventricosus]|uniref:Uncharacterized protein n=1 Tax=Araneus ventricosus TaxID=182803 RepID=A0A4Y2D027_ARAVE|nr:hypothetical protein AVEN_92895-1 [Araneus ventricosus]